MNKILVTGGSGFLGGNFCRYYAGEFELHATCFQHTSDLPFAEWHCLNLSDNYAVIEFLNEIQPEGIIHLAALSDPNACELLPQLSEEANLVATENLVEWAAANGSRFLFASTDLVFDGEEAPYSESDLPLPLNVYGTHKSVAETIVEDVYPEAAICRLPLMYGAKAGHGQSFLQPLMQKLANGEEVKLFTDEYRSVASARDVAAGLLLCLQKGEGIYHLAGPQRLSRYEMGQYICKAFGYDDSLLRPSLQSEVKFAAARPKDVSMTAGKALALGWEACEMEAELLHIKNWMNAQQLSA